MQSILLLPSLLLNIRFAQRIETGCNTDMTISTTRAMFTVLTMHTISTTYTMRTTLTTGTEHTMVTKLTELTTDYRFSHVLW